MITELEHRDFHKCSGLLNDKGQLEAKAIIAGINAGRVFVDDAAAPDSGLIWLGNNDGFIFIGNENNERFNKDIMAFIDKVIAPEAKGSGLKWFEGVGNHEKWNHTIEILLKNRAYGSWLQKVYLLHEEQYKPVSEPMLPEGYSIQKISKSLYENDNGAIKNTEFLHGKILEFWSSADRFFRKGAGYCIDYKNEIVSVCFSGFVVENIHCINIETLEDHQGKKLAQIIAHAFAKECLNNNMVPYWDCMEGNKPSVAVAENLGFQHAFNYTGYEFLF